MIKLKDLIKEVGPKSNKGEETIPIKHKTSGKELVIVDTLKNRKKYTKMGYIIPLPKHLQKLIKDLEKRDKEFSKYGVEVTDVIVPGLEWMNDIPEGVVKKETQQLNEDDFASKALDILHYAREDFDTEISKLTKILKRQVKIRKTSNLAKFNTIYLKYIDGFYKAALKIASDVRD